MGKELREGIPYQQWDKNSGIAGGLQNSIIAKHPAEMPELTYQVSSKKTRGLFRISIASKPQCYKIEIYYYSIIHENTASMRHTQNRQLEN